MITRSMTPGGGGTTGLDTHAMLRKLQELVPNFKPADLHGLPPTPPSPARGEGATPAPQSRPQTTDPPSLRTRWQGTELAPRSYMRHGVVHIEIFGCTCYSLLWC